MLFRKKGTPFYLLRSRRIIFALKYKKKMIITLLKGKYYFVNIKVRLYFDNYIARKSLVKSLKISQTLDS